MPDGSSTERGAERICENGKYFCKRDRNKAGTISIYTCKGRQTVRIPNTAVRTPEEAELALARYVLTNVEAVIRERRGITKVDMYVKECLSIYSIARDAFHDEVVKKARANVANAQADRERPERIEALTIQVESAKEAARKERVNRNLTIKNLDAVWPGDGPTVSQLDQIQQLHCVTVLRGLGYADSTIDLEMRIMRGAMRHCTKQGRLLYPVPAPLSEKEWRIESDQDDIVAYTFDEFAACFIASQRQESWWRFMNLAIEAPRLMTIMEAVWEQFRIAKGEELRWNLNPPGKRRTSKRRPIIPVCPTLAAEMRTWKRDNVRVITNGRGKAITGALMFVSIRKAAGLKRGSQKSIRKFIRTWLAINSVPDAIADWFMGHADEGSETGQAHYKDKKPEYMIEVVKALEKLYDKLRPLLTKRRLAGGPEIQEDQPTIDDLLKSLRGSGVTKLIATA